MVILSPLSQRFCSVIHVFPFRRCDLCHLQMGAMPALLAGSGPSQKTGQLSPGLPEKPLSLHLDVNGPRKMLNGGDWAEDLKGDRKGKSKLNKTLKQQTH